MVETTEVVATVEGVKVVVKLVEAMAAAEVAEGVEVKVVVKEAAEMAAADVSVAKRAKG